MLGTKSITLTVVRHGQTDANVKKLVHGTVNNIFIFVITHHLSIFINLQRNFLLIQTADLDFIWKTLKHEIIFYCTRAH